MNDLPGQSSRGATRRDGTPTIAIMQGRLSPPVGSQLQAFPAVTWAAEFQRAADAGLDAIEWIFEAPDNPILAEDGATRVRKLHDVTGVAVHSICADYFMDAPLHRGSDAEIAARVQVLAALIDRGQEIGVSHIVLPFVDQSAIRDDSDRDRLVDVLGGPSGHARARRVELHLETSLPPAEFASLLERVPDEVRANYDSGNSASLGYDVAEELAAYGERVGSVHVKDRVRGGGSVALGTGSVNFVAFFNALRRLRYGGLYTLQAARGNTGAEVDWARTNREFVLRHLEAEDR